MPLDLAYSDLLREVALSQALARDPGQWSPEDRTDVEDAIRQGQRRFYFPPGYVWSFLTPTRQLALVASQDEYDLPDDFAGGLSELAASTGAITRVAETQLRLLQATAPLSDSPKHYALRTKPGEPSRWQIVLYPTPSAALTASYRSRIEPPELSHTQPHALGGAIHSETLLAACCAALERKLTDQDGVWAAKFTELLATSMALDKEFDAAEQDVWPVNPAQELEVNRLYLLRLIGMEFGFGPNSATWDPAQSAKVQLALETGLRNFYAPAVVVQDPESRANSILTHEWSFLKPRGKLWIPSGADEAELPEDFALLIGSPIYTSNPAPIAITSDVKVRASKSATPGRPSYACLQVSGGKYRLSFERPADALYEVDFLYRINPLSLRDAELPQGGEFTHQALIECCLAAVEVMKGTPGVHSQGVRLQAAIERDRQIIAGDSQVWPTDHLPSGLEVSRAYLKRLIALELGLPAHPSAWTLTQQNEIKLYLEQGLRSFYHPLGHEWSFLRKSSSLSSASGQTTITLPADFSALDGPLAYTSGEQRQLAVVGEGKIRSIKSTDSGKPLYCAMRAADSGYELVFERPFDAAYEIEYRYVVNPAAIDGEDDLPLGGQFHHQTIIEACLSCVEQSKGAAGHHTQKFADRLTASITRDKLLLTDGEVWPAENLAAGLEVSKAYLSRVIGMELGYGPHKRAWTDAQANQVRLALETGLRTFYFPSIITPEGTLAHDWTFLRPTRLLSATINTSKIDLPADFSAPSGPLTYQAADKDEQRQITLVSEAQIRSIAQAASGQPVYAAIQTVGEGKYQLVFDRPFNANYELQFRYQISPISLGQDVELPLGGEFHHQAIVDACRAAAETQQGPPAAKTAMFIERLKASIARDRALVQAGEVWPDITSDGLRVNKAYLKRLIGMELKFGPHSGSWSTAEANRVQIALESGLRNLYTPGGYEWGFLRPRGKIVFKEGLRTAELPADFSMLDGPLSYEPADTVACIEIYQTSEWRVREMQQQNRTGRPELAALQAKSGGGYHLLIDAIPDQDYAVDFRYKINPVMLGEEVDLPMGGEVNHQCVLESCLAAVELMTKGPGQHTAEFKAKLAEAIDRDRRLHCPDSLGVNFDPASVDPVDYRSRQTYVVTYNGVEYD